MSGISAGSACFMVRDESLKNRAGKFWEYLEEEGFRSWGVKGKSGLDTVYINVNTKIYAPGIAGVPVTSCIVSCNPDNALSIYEFKAIWEILRERRLQGKRIIVAGTERLNELTSPPAERTAIISVVNDGEKEHAYRKDCNIAGICKVYTHVSLRSAEQTDTKEEKLKQSSLIEDESIDKLKTFLETLDSRTTVIIIHSELSMNYTYQPILYAIASAIEQYLNVIGKSKVTVSPGYGYSRDLKLCDDICLAIGVKPIEVPRRYREEQKYMSRDEYEMRVKKDLYYYCVSSREEINALIEEEKDWFWSYYEEANGDYEKAVDLAITNFSMQL